MIPLTLQSRHCVIDSYRFELPAPRSHVSLEGISHLPHYFLMRKCDACVDSYIAFKTKDEHDGDDGVGICAYTYNGKGGINHEMNGVIDASKNNPGLAFLGRGGANFSCNREDSYHNLVLVGTPPNDAYAGESSSSNVVLTKPRGQPIKRMLHDMVLNEGHPAIDVLWTIDNTGLLTKIHIDSARSLKSRSVESFQLDAHPTSLTLDPSSDSVIVGGPVRTVKIARARCDDFVTCDSCILSADPYCGWCSSSGTCQSATSCNMTAWQPSVGGDVVTCPVAPKAVVLVAEVLSSTTVKLTWSVAEAAKSGGTFENVFYDVIANGQPVDPTAVSGTSLDLSDLAPFTTYSVVVQAHNSGGTSISNTVVAVTLEAAPAEPLPPTVVATSAANTRLTWSAPDPPNGIITRYIVVRDGGDEVCCEGTQTSFVDSGLAPYTVYSYTVGAATVAGVGPQSTAAAARTAESTPGPPDTPVASEVTASAATLRWAPPPQPNGVLTQYVLYVGDTRVWRATDDTYTPLGTEAALKGLSPSTAYNFSVQAVTGAGPGARSAPVQVRTAEVAPDRPDPPTLLAADEELTLSVSAQYCYATWHIRCATSCAGVLLASSIYFFYL